MFIQVTLETLLSIGSSLTEVIFDSNNAEKFDNGTWRAIVTELSPGIGYNITIRSSKGIYETGIPSEPVSIVTASGKF